MITPHRLPPRVLVVDDEHLIRELMAQLLRNEGHEVTVAASAEEGVTELAQSSLDLVVSDLCMPGKGGFHLLSESKRIDPTTPFVLITAHGDVESSVEALRLGADDFLAKPIHMPELLHTCRRAIEKGRLLRENRAQRERLEHLYQLKSQFLASMSHELRTPLTTIIGMSEILADGVIGELSAKQKRYARSIGDSAGHLLSIISDILDYSRIEMGKMPLELAPFSPSEAMQAARMLADSAAAARQSHLEIVTLEELPEVFGDRAKIVQILVNLLSNAIKFSPAGSVVRLGCEVRDDEIHFSVVDPGIGIASASLEGIFEEFQQATVPGSGKPPGTGLGLALSRRLARLHGGDLRVESVPGSGSTFTFVLPKAGAHAQAAGVAS